MKRVLIIAMVVVWAAAALLFVGYLAQHILGGNTNLSRVSFGVSLESVKIKEQTVAMSDVESLDLSAKSVNIRITVTDADAFTFVQFGDENTAEEDKFQLAQSGGTLGMTVPSVIRIGINFSNDRMEIYVPRSWTGAVNAATSSGGLVVDSSFVWRATRLSSTSGGVKLTGNLDCDSLVLESSSGGIGAEGALRVAGSLAAENRSGGISLADVTAQNATLATTSGGIKVRGNVKLDGDFSAKASSGGVRMEGAVTAKTVRLQTTSGSLHAERIGAERYVLESSSGGVKVEELSGGGELHSTSGSVTAGLVAPVGDVDASASSGSVRLTVPGALSFSFEGTSSSGSVKANFELLYRDSDKKTAVAAVGGEPAVRITAKTSSGSIRIDRKG